MLLKNREQSFFCILIIMFITCSGFIWAASIVVDSTGDESAVAPGVSPLTLGGTITLRSAIEYANANVDPSNTVNFAIAGVGPHTIAPQALLPPITKPITIDGYTQVGSSPNTDLFADNAQLMIELQGGGQANPFVFYGLLLDVGSDGSLIRGLVINNLLGNPADTPFGLGIIIVSSGNTIAGNFIGTNVDGTGVIPVSTGILIIGPGNTIGGIIPSDRNIIAGSNVFRSCVEIDSSDNFVFGNLIGVDKTGTLALNCDDGIDMFGGVNNTIGGASSGERNIIRANICGVYLDFGSTDNFINGNFIGTDVTGNSIFQTTGKGIFLLNGSDNNSITSNLISGGTNGIDLGFLVFAGFANNNTVQGNLIGTNVSGTSGLGNTFNGIIVSAGDGNFIGGNTVSANQKNGILLAEVATNTTIQGNFIGTDKSGIKVIPNGFNGIQVGVELASGNELNTIGGSLEGEGNIISGNNGNGISLQQVSNSTTVRGNSIGVNVSRTAALPNGGNGIAILCSSNNVID